MKSSIVAVALGLGLLVSAPVGASDRAVVEAILQSGNRFIVRGKETGTPVKPMFGVDPQGKSFEIMSIDIHTVENGRIVQSYHVEEWHRAVRQLKAQ